MNGLRLGLIARLNDHRGLAYQTAAYHKHLQPDKTLWVRMGKWTCHPETGRVLGPNERVSHFDGHRPDALETDAIVWLTEHIDVLLSAETFYDSRLPGLCKHMGVRTALVVNPEFARPDLVEAADLVINPSGWRSEALPGIVLPHPVDRDDFPFSPRPIDPGQIRFLHIGGHRAIYDRAGTEILIDAMRRTQTRHDVTIRTQSLVSGPATLALRALRSRAPHVVQEDIAEPRMLYHGFDVLVAPRRYGGLTLPILEAASSGLAILAADREPERSLLPPETLVPVRERRLRRFQSGEIPIESAHPASLAARMDSLAADPDGIAALSEASDALAERLSWPALRSRWEAALCSLLEREAVGA